MLKEEVYTIHTRPSKKTSTSSGLLVATLGRGAEGAPKSQMNPVSKHDKKIIIHVVI